MRAITFAILFVGFEVDLANAIRIGAAQSYRAVAAVFGLACLIGAVVCIIGGW